MKKYFFCGLLIVASIASSAMAEVLTGRDLAVKARQADSSADASRKATMVIERGSKKLVRKMQMWDKKYGFDKRSLIRFEEPADVRDTQYLSWIYEAVDKDDDLWVYLPTENQIRRISGGGKKGSFVRSDFANEDIEQRAIDDDIHKLLEITEFNGRKCYVLVSIPVKSKAKDSNYGKRLTWLDQEYWLPLKIEYYDKRNRLIKTLTQGGIEKIEGIWTATKLIMATPKNKSRTLMQYHNVRYNTGLQDSLFQQSALER